VHDLGVDDQDTVDERGAGVRQANHNRVGIIRSRTVSQQIERDAATITRYARVFDDLRTPVVVCPDNRMRSRGPRLKG
jgi:hypothetical protein